MSLRSMPRRVPIALALVALVTTVLAAPSAAADPPPYQQHWAILDGWNRSSSPVIADIDADGRNEVVMGHQDGYLRAFEEDGTLKWATAAIPGTGAGCRAQGYPSSIDSSPTVADLDKDGVPEVIVGVGSAWSPDQNGSVIAFDGQTGAIEWRTDDSRDLLDIWTQEVVLDGWCEATFATPAIGDVDGDGWDDVVFSSWDFYIWAVDRFGQPLPGFPFNNDDSVWSSPALFDIDGDGRDEIFVGGDSTPLGYFDHLGGVFRALDWNNGAVTELWHRTANEVIMGSPAIGDIDNDGRPDVVVTPGEYWHLTCAAGHPQCRPGDGSDHNLVFAWHLDDGSDVPGWPVATGDTVMASPALGDLDGDGDLEVVVGGWDTYVRAWHGDGTPMWAVQPEHGAAHLGPSIVAGQPIIADLDGDGDQDVAVGSATGLALLDGRTGASFEAGKPWYERLGAGWSYESAPAVGVLQGKRQIVFAGFDTPNRKTRIAAFDLAGATSIQDDWPMFRGNAQRTGVAGDVVCDGFCDVPRGAYYENAVDWMVARGITTGVTEALYGPHMSLNRAQMVTFLWRQGGEKTGYPAHGFVDVPAGSYYDLAVAWAKAEGVTAGTSTTTFSPTSVVTRAQLVTLLHRRAGTPGGWPTPSFADVPTGTYYTSAVHWAAATGVTGGITPTRFAPEDPVTRAQAAALLYREAGSPPA